MANNPFILETRLPATVQKMASHLARCLLQKLCKGTPIYEHITDDGRVMFVGSEEQVRMVQMGIEYAYTRLEPRLVHQYAQLLLEMGIYEEPADKAIE